MIRVRLQIGSGNIVDTTTYGLVYLSSDHKLAAPSKGFETSAYPEEEGEHILSKTVDDAFDYKITFFIESTTLNNANAKIKAFNDLLYTQETGQDTKVFKQVTFYNDYKKVKIVGYPSPIAEAKEFWRDSTGAQHDVVTVEWTIRVIKPSLCDFNLTTS